MRAFITGITGFIGSHVAETLLRDGHQVVGAARKGWHGDAPRRLVDSVELLEWDIRTPASEALTRALCKSAPTAIFHFAAISIPSKCGRDHPTEQALAVNVEGTSNLLDLVEQLPGAPRVIFSSTSHVYGPVDRGTAHVTETAHLNPTSAYGQTKLMCEEAILDRVCQGAIKACIARGFHHIGPRQPSNLMLTDWIGQLRDPAVTDIHVRSTNSYLDLIDVRDAALGYRLLATDGKIGEVYNLGSGKVNNSGDVLENLLTLVDRNLNVVSASAEERWNAIADISRLSSLGWSPQIEYPRTLRDMIAVV